VAPAVDQLVADAALLIAGAGPVAVVEVLDQLEGPPALDHVAPDDRLAQALGLVGMTGVVEQVGGGAEEQVGVPEQLVELVQVAAGPFDPLHGLAHLAHRLDGGVVDAVGPAVGVVGGQLVWRHAAPLSGGHRSTLR
jgi:hypothetical protein